MESIFSFGIHALWDELQQMTTGGIWWVNTDQAEDAQLLANSTLAAQSDQALAAVITMGENASSVIELDQHHGPERIQLFNMPENKNSLYSLSSDLLCSITPDNYLFIFLVKEGFWRSISGDAIKQWLSNMKRWVKTNNCTILIINPDNNSDKATSLLSNQHQSLSGIASVRQEQGEYILDVTFWLNKMGVSARQRIALNKGERGWSVKLTEKHEPQQRSDERQILSHSAVLEGAPILSEYWSLFADNEAVFTEARQHHAATAIFALENNQQIDHLANCIHTLRKQRGSVMKLVVRETRPGLRATDERLLMACGANIIVPYNAPLSRCLNMIESVQGQFFTRDVPDDISLLTASLRPLNLRGFQPWDKFCDAVKSALNNPMAPKDSKGVLVALRPVPGLRVEQLLTLCKTNRMGDFVTLGNNRLMLFLSYCRINDLEVALRHIFPLPVGDIISNRVVWFEDNDIAAEMTQMRTIPETDWQTPISPQDNDPLPVNAEHSGRVWRRVPVPLTLLQPNAEGQNP
ncbi:cellulose biosynthesis protein BcsE [Mangrovibacter yixingensis]|uniref:cellulose biosynthesis protein BcsE n=1 Tax=Mangrovibacter yixingensis TaxID=1529639 RepID=UPI001CFE8174|nr:cellulose biosynthesis protein BcsE [Mangrovibacter yixingensis]